VVSDQVEEGTLFSLEQLIISTTAGISNHLSTLFPPNASTAQIKQLLAAYLGDPAAESTFKVV
jgi:hypothetical protein